MRALVIMVCVLVITHNVWRAARIPVERECETADCSLCLWSSARHIAIAVVFSGVSFLAAIYLP